MRNFDPLDTRSTAGMFDTAEDPEQEYSDETEESPPPDEPAKEIVPDSWVEKYGAHLLSTLVFIALVLVIGYFLLAPPELSHATRKGSRRHLEGTWSDKPDNIDYGTQPREISSLNARNGSTTSTVATIIMTNATATTSTMSTISMTSMNTTIGTTSSTAETTVTLYRVPVAETTSSTTAGVTTAQKHIVPVNETVASTIAAARDVGNKATTTATTTTTTTSTTTIVPRKAQVDGHLVCTFGREATDPAMYPIQQNLCDLIIYTDVTLTGHDFVSTTGKRAFETFKKVAKANRDAERLRFGISVSPKHLKKFQNNNGRDPIFEGLAEKYFLEYHIVTYGSLGWERSVSELAEDVSLITWIQSMSSAIANIDADSMTFFGARIREEYHTLDSSVGTARTLFEVLNKMKIRLFILITHNADIDRTKCVSTPTSAWLGDYYLDTTRPALKSTATLLERGLPVSTFETALSFTMGYLRYIMRNDVKPSAPYEQPCVHVHMDSLVAYCVEDTMHEQFTDGVLTNTNYDARKLNSYESVHSIHIKMTKVLQSLRQHTRRRIGWAVFDVQYEVFNSSECSPKHAGMGNFARLAKVRQVLDESKNPRLK